MVRTVKIDPLYLQGIVTGSMGYALLPPPYGERPYMPAECVYLGIAGVEELSVPARITWVESFVLAEEDNHAPASGLQLIVSFKLGWEP